MENNTVDARGLSCPQPVLLVNKKVEELNLATIEVLLDEMVAVENVSRLLKNKGYKIEVIESNGDYIIKGDKN